MMRETEALRLLLVLLALHALLEVLDALPQPAAELGDAAGPEDQDEDQEDEKNLLKPYTKHDSLQGIAGDGENVLGRANPVQQIIP
jgi:hypothetical protein